MFLSDLLSLTPLKPLNTITLNEVKVNFEAIQNMNFEGGHVIKLEDHVKQNKHNKKIELVIE